MPETPLQMLIREHIITEGPMPFRDFMALVLYHPEHGYYASGRAQIGRKGDFFTNVSVGPLFGQLLVSQFQEMWERLGRPRAFTIVEQGAHDGDFAHDVLTWAQANAPDLFKALNYVIIEPFARMREKQKTTLGELGHRVAWRESVAELEPFCGVHFSNELLDAFPVHLVRFMNGEWRIRCVGPTLEWVDEPVEKHRELESRLTAVDTPRIESYTTEINLDALAWADEISAKLSRGWVLAIDYGYPREVFYNPSRTGGTLSCFAAHRRNFDPLQDPGAQDITAHVDFTSLAERAEANGLRLAGFTDQHHFIVALVKHFFAAQPPDPKQARMLQTLVHPQFLGTVFKVLALEKNANPDESVVSPLRGFEFGSNPRVALGLV